MSPEQAEGKPVKARSDVFSFGIVMYEMATGQQPLEGDTAISTITSILRDTPVPIGELKPEMPRHLGRACNLGNPGDHGCENAGVHDPEKSQRRRWLCQFPVR
jgi:serine/threonine protein kinase